MKILTDDEGSDGDGDECLMRMKGSSMWLHLSDATPNVAQFKMLQRRPLH